LDAAAASFKATLRELGLSGDEPELGDAARLGQRAALVAAASALWQRHLGPLLDLRQAQQLLGGGRRGRGSSEAAMAILEAPAATARTRRIARDRGGAHEAMEEGMGEERFSHAACSASSRTWVKRAMSNNGRWRGWRRAAGVNGRAAKVPAPA